MKTSILSFFSFSDEPDHAEYYYRWEGDMSLTRVSREGPEELKGRGKKRNRNSRRRRRRSSRRRRKEEEVEVEVERSDNLQDHRRGLRGDVHLFLISHELDSCRIPHTHFKMILLKEDERKKEENGKRVRFFERNMTSNEKQKKTEKRRKEKKRKNGGHTPELANRVTRICLEPWSAHGKVVKVANLLD